MSFPHKMNEVMHNADRITVLKGGMVEDTMLAEDATVERLTRAVVGNREQKELRVDREHLGERCVLKVESLSALDDKGLTALKNVSLDIHAG